jgi:GNAT superfamily N-acetyltransferase
MAELSEQHRMMTFRRFHVHTAEYENALNLREDILRKPLGLTLTENDLARDAECFHLGGFHDSQLRAVLLLQPLDEHAMQMRQVAVCPGWQRTGAGSQLVAFAEEFARLKGCKTLIAHARSTALGFYLRLGYSAAGEEFIETTIAHRLVAKAL